MKSSLLVFVSCILIGIAMSTIAQAGSDQSNAMATVYPQNVNYWTGTTDGATKTDISEVRGLNTEDGWFVFDISSIPDGSTIDSIRFYGYVNATYFPYWSATPLPGLDPLTATAADLKTAIQANSGSGVAYLYRNESSTFAIGWHDYTMGNTANADFQAALTQDWFAMGMDSRDNSTTYYVNFDGWNQTNDPYLEVYYTAPSNIFEDNFDSYIAGQQLACQDSINWTTWSNLPCDPVEDAFISSTYSYSGANSCKLVLNNDLVRLHGSKTTGKWYTSFIFFIPTGKAGYFNQMSGFAPNPNQWAMECYFDVGGGGRLLNGATVTFTWLENTWQQVMLVVDLDTHLAELWIGTTNPLTQVATWDWTRGGTITNRIDANDFFGATANDEMYMDNYYFGDVMPSIIPVELVSFAATASEGLVDLSWITATEINNQGFEVQRSSSGEFETIAFVEGHGTTTETQVYSYSDRNVSGGSYSYRLKQIDFDGTFEYSKVVEVEVPIVSVFALDQNYPNPFNPSTTINFKLAVDSKVNLKVFDVLGQEVATLLSGNISAGSHQVNFNASSLNSGVYLYKIEATGIDGTNFTDVKKMILTK